MSWTYLKHDENGELLSGEKEKAPAPGSVYLAFDALRWKTVLGFTETGGQLSMLNPNVCDDCNIIAFAPLYETTEPNEYAIRENCPWSQAAYQDADTPTLMRWGLTTEPHHFVVVGIIRRGGGMNFAKCPRCGEWPEADIHNYQDPFVDASDARTHG